MKTISIARRVSLAAAVLAGVLALAQPIPAQARGGGGGGHGGGFGGGGHGGGFSGGGFHSGGFGGGGFSGGGFHGGMFGAGGLSGSQGGGFHGAHFGGRDGFRNRGGFDGWSGGEWGWDAPYYDNGYGNSDYGADGYNGYSQPYTSQYWYCQNPAGYFPYVQQCGTYWQPVPAG